MSLETARAKLIMMDEKLSFGFPLMCRIKVADLKGRAEYFEFGLLPGTDLQRFIYGILNPFLHSAGHPINGENYHSAFFYAAETSFSRKKNLTKRLFFVKHSMFFGLYPSGLAAISSNQFIATFKTI